MQVKPLAPPQEPSVEGFLEAVLDGVGVGVTTFLVVVGVAALADETAPAPVQVPKPVWQPVPQ